MGGGGHHHSDAAAEASNALLREQIAEQKKEEANKEHELAKEQLSIIKGAGGYQTDKAPGSGSSTTPNNGFLGQIASPEVT